MQLRLIAEVNATPYCLYFYRSIADHCDMTHTRCIIRITGSPLVIDDEDTEDSKPKDGRR